MIQVYTREGCHGCLAVKSQLKFYNLPYQEFVVDKDVPREYILERFPGVNKLPIIAVNDLVVSGVEAEKMLTEYKENFGKQLLTEGK